MRIDIIHIPILFCLYTSLYLIIALSRVVNRLCEGSEINILFYSILFNISIEYIN